MLILERRNRVTRDQNTCSVLLVIDNKNAIGMAHRDMLSRWAATHTAGGLAVPAKVSPIVVVSEP
ncbi:MAG: hypothetical protein GWO29_03900 [Gammaproteobacteria bacterium]|nr:hypothetical protein [Gammaproteobacteria bacterium]NIO25913.1 hypothetical protein [Gammaproteobacteria bacterium]NIP45572.1 hypothetical protein [Gammaproteobacteria bacterium]NIP65578.1 hypothetical protein [Gammaproteobacteria bacterium]NIR20809.1 hypothetical protein [Gammaproteobacteria bacterium]